MATINRTLSTKTGGDGKSEIMLRVSMNRQSVFRIRSGVFIKPDRFKDGRFIIPKANQVEAKEVRAVERKLNDIEQSIYDYCTERGNMASKEDILALVNPDKYKVEDETTKSRYHVPTLLDSFLRDKGYDYGTAKGYHVLRRALDRFERYKRLSSDKTFILSIESLTDTIKDEIVDFLFDESKAFALYPEIYVDYETRKARKTPKAPEQRGHNTLVAMIKKLSAILRWSNENGNIKCDPAFNVARVIGTSSEIYGEPIYITTEERDKIRDFDMSKHPSLAIQRDIFIFQCYVGCRVSDLKVLTKANIVDDYLHYIPKKTEKKNTNIVRVPLLEVPKTILRRYDGIDRKGRIFPFISDQKYNDSLKQIFRVCGIDRNVTYINPKTGRQEQRPIYEIASSHMARKAFAGNLYQVTQDPNLIGSMTGHVEGSKAFARYRKIDDDVKLNVLKGIE